MATDIAGEKDIFTCIQRMRQSLGKWCNRVCRKLSRL